MIFSVVSNLPEASGILEAVRSSQVHQIVAERIDSGDADAGSLQMDGQCEVTHPTADSVLIAVKSQSMAVALARSAAEAGKSVLWFPPHDLDSAGIYELTQIAIDHSVAIVPVRGSWWITDEFAALTAASNRHSTGDRRHQTAPTIASAQLSVNCPRSDGDVARAVELFAMDIVRGVTGNAPQLTAIRIESPGGAVQQETITLGFGDGKSAEAGSDFPSQVIINCTLQPGTPPQSTLTLSFSDSSSTSCEIFCPGLGPPSTTADARVLDQRIIPALDDRMRAVTEFTDFSKSEELFAAIRESLRRRRTIDVYYDTASERSVFKTQMTAIGCGVLTWLTLGLVAYLVLAQLLEPPVWALHVARVIWIAPVVVFLIVQFLLPLTRGALGGAETKTSD